MSKSGKRNPMMTAIPRFWAKVVKTQTCWLWTGHLNDEGYGQLRMGRGRSVYAHRFSYMIHKGPLGRRDKVLHGCDNPRCVNPFHLSKGTTADNNADAKRKGRTAQGPRHWNWKGGKYSKSAKAQKKTSPTTEVADDARNREEAKEKLTRGTDHVNQDLPNQ